MVHPEYRRVAGDIAPLDETLTPIYPLTEGLPQGRLRALINAALESHGAALREWLPHGAGLPPGLPSLGEALHLPAPPAAQRATRRARRRAAPGAAAPGVRGAARASPDAQAEKARAADRSRVAARRCCRTRATVRRRRCPSSSPARRRACSPRCAADLGAHVPMVRLLQGDVGCGKTVVAAAAAAQAAGSGLQAALMAPTELLAEQHWRNFHQWFRPLELPVALLSGRQPARARRSALAAVASGEVRVVVGTHALFQEGIEFARLALVIVDEQHRFGVQQRLQAAEKGRKAGRLPHQLIMTATPIPRTLAMTAYADLDVSVIDELPPGRTPVRTVVLPQERRARGRGAHRRGLPRRPAGLLGVSADRRVRRAARAGRGGDRAAAGRRRCPSVRIGLVHGRMPPATEGRGDARLPGGQDPAAGRHDCDRGGGRRARTPP